MTTFSHTLGSEEWVEICKDFCVLVQANSPQWQSLVVDDILMFNLKPERCSTAEEDWLYTVTKTVKPCCFIVQEVGIWNNVSDLIKNLPMAIVPKGIPFSEKVISIHISKIPSSPDVASAVLGRLKIQRGATY
jgi:hypothetical protein